jgi:tetratricopeptide (TPR) repeat protein
MYLRGSKWRMTRRRRRANPWFLAFLILAIGAFTYINVVIVPATPPLFIPTRTPTTNPQSYADDAAGLEKSGKYVQAINAYQQAIQSDPKNPANYIAIARLQIIMGKYLDAQKNAEKATLLNRNSAPAQAVLGRALALQGDYLPAEAALKNALGLDPNNALAHAFYAEMLAQQVNDGKGQLGTMDKAADESRKALAIDSNSYETHQARGLVLEMTSNYQDAVYEYQAALALNDNIASLHLSLGRIYYVNMENYVQAVEEFTKAYALNPGDPLPNLYISRVYVKTGDYPKAAQYAEQALKDNPVDPYLQGNLGSMYYKLGQYEDAILHLRLTIRGGTTEDGLAVKGIPLDKDNRIMEFYSRYGLALAHINACSEGLQIAQAMLQGVGDDETAVYNANEMIRICKENLTGTATPTKEALPAGNTTPTP